MLLELPAELRLRIFRYNDLQATVNLSSTCKQLYTENHNQDIYKHALDNTVPMENGNVSGSQYQADMVAIISAFHRTKESKNQDHPLLSVCANRVLESTQFPTEVRNEFHVSMLCLLLLPRVKDQRTYLSLMRFSTTEASFSRPRFRGDVLAIAASRADNSQRGSIVETVQNDPDLVRSHVYRSLMPPKNTEEAEMFRALTSPLAMPDLDAREEIVPDLFAYAKKQVAPGAEWGAHEYSQLYALHTNDTLSDAERSSGFCYLLEADVSVDRNLILPYITQDKMRDPLARANLIKGLALNPPSDESAKTEERSLLFKRSTLEELQGNNEACATASYTLATSQEPTEEELKEIVARRDAFSDDSCKVKLNMALLDHKPEEWDIMYKDALAMEKPARTLQLGYLGNKAEGEERTARRAKIFQQLQTSRGSGLADACGLLLNRISPSEVDQVLELVSPHNIPNPSERGRVYGRCADAKGATQAQREEILENRGSPRAMPSANGRVGVYSGFIRRDRLKARELVTILDGLSSEKFAGDQELHEAQEQFVYEVALFDSFRRRRPTRIQ